jgi:hypothetical protein
MEAEHHNLQSMAAIGALEEAGLDEVIGVTGREIDPTVGQAVAVGGTARGSAWPEQASSRPGGGTGLNPSSHSSLQAQHAWPHLQSVFSRIERKHHSCSITLRKGAQITVKGTGSGTPVEA